MIPGDLIPLHRALKFVANGLANVVDHSPEQHPEDDGLVLVEAVANEFLARNSSMSGDHEEMNPFLQRILGNMERSYFGEWNEEGTFIVLPEARDGEVLPVSDKTFPLFVQRVEAGFDMVRLMENMRSGIVAPVGDDATQEGTAWTGTTSDAANRRTTWSHDETRSTTLLLVTLAGPEERDGHAPPGHACLVTLAGHACWPGSSLTASDVDHPPGKADVPTEPEQQPLKVLEEFLMPIEATVENLKEELRMRGWPDLVEMKSVFPRFADKRSDMPTAMMKLRLGLLRRAEAIRRLGQRQQWNKEMARHLSLEVQANIEAERAKTRYGIFSKVILANMLHMHQISAITKT